MHRSLQVRAENAKAWTPSGNQKFALRLGQRGRRKPVPAALAEQVSGIFGNKIGVEHGLDPTLHPPDRPHQSRAFRDEPTQVQGFVIGDPDLWQEAGGMKLGQYLRVDLVGLHARVGDGLHLQRVRDHNPRHERCQQPDDGRRIPGCFQDNLVILPKPLSKYQHGVVVELDPDFRGELAPIKDRDLRETSMHIHSDRPHAKSPCCRWGVRGLCDIYGYALAAQTG